MNYCGTHEPCMNGGTCENPAPDEYLCKCPEGFSGTNCQVVDNVCATAPCLHGGNCSVVQINAVTDSNAVTGFNCSCPPGWTGDTCQISKFFFLRLLHSFKDRMRVIGLNPILFSSFLLSSRLLFFFLMLLPVSRMSVITIASFF